MTAGAVLLVAALVAQPAATRDVGGRVLDPAGLPVEGAEVSAGGRAVSTDSRGEFTLAVAEAEPVLRVRAAGFADALIRATGQAPLRVVLQPAAVAEVLTVTAGRTDDRVADTASATSAIPSSVVLTSAALAPDDLLRTVPGFSLFRRSSSRVANPTTQGASLRGLAASGASRALVLADGLPLNDPFGGWVYWNRVPQAAIDRLEVVRGGAGSDLYGPESLAGTVQLIAIRPARATARVLAEAGTSGTARGSVYAGGRGAGWSGFAAAERLAFDGYIPVAPEERGPVDVRAGSTHTALLGSAARAGSRAFFDARANWLDEERENGTPLQENDTRLWSVAARSGGTHAKGTWSASAHAGGTQYRQTFTAVNADRTAEVLTARQHIDADYQGVSARWSGAVKSGALLAGGDFRRNSGTSEDVARGGTQTDSGVYARLTLQPRDEVTFSAGIRAGLWTTGRQDGGGEPPQALYVMPRVSIAWSPSRLATLSASWSAPGRTPTLNELYRDFRVGGTLTLANPQLRPEEANSFEAGVLVRGRSASARVVGFWTGIDDAIANVTLSSGVLITRQRQNAGGIRARGLELEAEWRVRPWASVVAGAAWFDSTFTRGPEPALVGNRVPQVPRWQASTSVRVTPPRAVASIDCRAIGPQYDDDLNQFLLRRAFIVDALVATTFRRLQPFAAIENVFDVEMDVGRTPVRTVGMPRSLRGGVRLFF